MSSLLELAARCEQAAGPDRELDAQIIVALEHPEYRYPDEVLNRRPSSWREAADRLRHDGMGGSYPYPDYTASLDAAMTQLDESWFFHVSRFSPGEGGGQAHVYPNRGLGDDYEADAASPALALCAAALKARAASCDRNPKGEKPQALSAEHESAVGSEASETPPPSDLSTDKDG